MGIGIAGYDWTIVGGIIIVAISGYNIKYVRRVTADSVLGVQ